MTMMTCMVCTELIVFICFFLFERGFMDNMQKLRGVLIRLKTAHSLYVRMEDSIHDESRNMQRLLDACEPLGDKLENLSGGQIDKSFEVLYVLFGDEFLTYEFNLRSMEEFIAKTEREAQAL